MKTLTRPVSYEMIVALDRENKYLQKELAEANIRVIAKDSFTPTIAKMNAAIREMLGYGMIHDVKRPLDMAQLRADYRAHKINLHDAPIQYMGVAKQLNRYYVPVLISRTMQEPTKPCRAIQFYVPVRAEDVEMAVSLASSIVRHQWATPRHSVNVSINGTVQL